MASVLELQKDFERLIKSERLSHGYLFFGREGTLKEKNKEKLRLAMALGSRLETGDWELRESPLLDSLIIHGESKEGIDAMREAIRFLWQKPLRSARKTVIIEELSLLSAQAQNAILKITEEPPEHALILILESDPYSLPGPLQSRLQRIYFSPVRRERAISPEAIKEINAFLVAPTAQRKELLKALADSDDSGAAAFFELADNFLVGLSRDTIQNHVAIAALLERIRYMRQFNTNKRLQLEAALLGLPAIKI